MLRTRRSASRLVSSSTWRISARAVVAQLVLELPAAGSASPGRRSGRRRARARAAARACAAFSSSRLCVEVALAVLERALALVELGRAARSSASLRAQALLEPRELGPARAQLVLELVAPRGRAGCRGRRRRAGSAASASRRRPAACDACAGAARAAPPPPRRPPRPAPPTRSPSAVSSSARRTARRLDSRRFVERCGAAPRDTRRRWRAARAPDRARAVQRLADPPGRSSRAASQSVVRVKFRSEA